MTRRRPLHVGRGALLRRTVLALRVLAAPRWLSADELAGVLGVDRRTAYRLVVAIAEMGLPVQRRAEDRRVRYHLAPRWWEERAAFDVERRGDSAAAA